MKHLILATAMLMSTTAFAARARLAAPEITPLPQGSSGLISVAGQVTSTASLCPAGVKCMVDGTVVQVLFTASGCLDILVPLTYEVIGEELVVHAQIATNASSAGIMCMAIPTYQKQITLVNQYPTKIRFLGTGVVADLK